MAVDSHLSAAASLGNVPTDPLGAAPKQRSFAVAGSAAAEAKEISQRSKRLRAKAFQLLEIDVDDGRREPSLAPVRDLANASTVIALDFNSAIAQICGSFQCRGRRRDSVNH